jgi:carbon monoxide dehydrogenase subunit G
VQVGRDARQVHEYVRDPRNLPRWAPAFARSVRRDGDRWLVETADGTVEVAFAADNPDGVADHRITGDGVDVLVPLRVHPDGTGARVTLTLQAAAGASEEEVARDVALVRSDLEMLKRVLEAPSG